MKRLQCDYCGDVFVNKTQISHHIDIHRKFSILQCKACNASSFTTTKILKAHLKGHLSPRICEFCAKPFARTVDLNLHIAAKHVMELKFNCSFCPRTFTTGKIQKEHETRIHKRKKKDVYKCTDCELSFTMRENLRVHSFQHYEGKVFDCGVEGCGKFFKSQSLLSVHLKSHSQEKQYQCFRCQKSFVQSSGLSKHLKKCNIVRKKPELISPEDVIRIAKMQYQELLAIKGRLIKCSTGKKQVQPSDVERVEIFDFSDDNDMDRRQIFSDFLGLPTQLIFFYVLVTMMNLV